MSFRTVSQLFIYPIKSLGGMALSQATVMPKGLQYDRRWMLVDENHQFMTQRNLPELALFKPIFQEETSCFIIEYSGGILMIPDRASGEMIEAMVWEDMVTVQEVSKDVSQWFSNHLGKTCKLVWFPEENSRKVDPDFAITAKDETSLSDGYPLLLIGQASLDDLNARLDVAVDMDRFRPNIVFEGGTPFEEDLFSDFSIGDVRMAGVKPCARCVMITIDQNTASKGKEPLATLSTYRKIGNKVLFGQNVIPLGAGSINVGDVISLG